MMIRWLILSCVAAVPAMADTVMPTRTIRADAIIGESDVTLSAIDVENGYARLSDVIGQEARVVLYPGRPIRFDDVGPPALVARNQVVLVQYTVGGLQITTEGRALERGAEGDRVRIMNLSSRATLFGQVRADGTIEVR